MNIVPVTDLRDYNKVLENCEIGKPVFLTKNGRGKFVLMAIEDYDRVDIERVSFKETQTGKICNDIFTVNLKCIKK